MTEAPIALRDQGCFWVGVDYERRGADTLPDGTQLYVEYQVPADLVQPYPVVLIHGGGAQATDWMSTPDGRPGWRTLLLQRGFAVYLLDRPGHGRSPRSLAETPAEHAATMPSVEGLGPLFAGRDDDRHTQWPGDGGPRDDALAQFLAAQRQTPFDLAHDHAIMRRRGAELLDRIGPAILVASSAGGPSAWLMADARPALAKAVVALEPLGPSGPVDLRWGLADSPLTYDPPPATGLERLELIDVPSLDGRFMDLRLQRTPPRTLPALSDLPIAIVSAERSFARRMDIGTVEFLRQAGCRRVEHLRLEDHGIFGNGHLMMLERNHEHVLDLICRWCQTQEAA